MMLTHKPAYARPVDPIHNFGVKVTIKKIRSSDAFKSKSIMNEKKKKKKHKGKKGDEENEDSSDTVQDPELGKMRTYTFGWQEKKFSPRELWNYRPESKIKSRWSRIEGGYHRQLVRLKNDNVDVKPEAGVTLSSKVDKDGYVPKEEKKQITTSHSGMTELGKSVVMISARTGHQRQTATKSRLKRELQFTTMHIMATVDLSEADLSGTKPKFEGKEIVLCSIKMNEKTGLIETKPPFKYEEFGSGGSLTNPMGDISTNNGDIRGRGTYQFRTNSGAIYEYTLANAAAAKDEIAAEEVEEQDIAADVLKVGEFRNRQGTRFPRAVFEETDVALSAFVEIVSATRFEEDSLYVQYQVAIPQVGWKWSPELSEGDIARCSSGSTQISTCSYNSTGKTPKDSLICPTANFSHPLDIHLVSSVHHDAERIHNWPKIFFEVGAAGSWGRHYNQGYGYMTIPRRAGSYDLTLKTWKPHGSIRQRMEDFFLGGSRHLSDPVNYIGLPKPSERGPFLNKYGFSSETSGDIRVRVHVVMQHKERAPTILPKAGSASAPQVKVKKSRGVNDILDSLQMNRSVNLKSVMGKARSGGNERLSSLYSKLRTSRDGGSRRGLSPERRSETPKKPSRLLNKLRASSKKKSEMSDSGSER